MNVEKHLSDLCDLISHSEPINGWRPDSDMHTGAIFFVKEGSEVWYATPGWENDDVLDCGIAIEGQNDDGDIVLRAAIDYRVTGNLSLDLAKYRELMGVFLGSR